MPADAGRPVVGGFTPGGIGDVLRQPTAASLQVGGEDDDLEQRAEPERAAVDAAATGACGGRAPAA